MGSISYISFVSCFRLIGAKQDNFRFAFLRKVDFYYDIDDLCYKTICFANEQHKTLFYKC